MAGVSRVAAGGWFHFREDGFQFQLGAIGLEREALAALAQLKALPALQLVEFLLPFHPADHGAAFAVTVGLGAFRAHLHQAGGGVDERHAGFAAPRGRERFGADDLR